MYKKLKFTTTYLTKCYNSEHYSIFNCIIKLDYINDLFFLQKNNVIHFDTTNLDLDYFYFYE